MADEFIEIIDRENNVIGQQVKSVAHQKGLRHRVSAVLLQNEKGQYLIPTASDEKVEAGGLYHSAAGHVHSGESYVQSALRELREETSLNASEDNLESMGTFWMEKDYPTRKEKERFEVFRVHYSKRMGKIKPNNEQINEQWLSEDELRGIYLKNPKQLSYPLKLSCKYIFKF